MKVTTPPRWSEQAPAWESHEVRDHYDPGADVLASSYLDEPIPLEEARERREQGEPLEYLLRHCHVGELTVKCDSRALIPRPETETLLRRFEDRLPEIPPGALIDCGTGTGVMAGWLSSRSDRTVIATERDPGAIALADENRDLHGWSYRLILGDRLSSLRGTFAGIVANLPYVFPGSDRIEDSVIEHEPDRALFIPGDPDAFYREFLEEASQRLRENGELWIEGSARLFERLEKRVLPGIEGFTWSHLNDETGRSRFLRGQRRS